VRSGIGLVDDEALNAYLDRVGQRLAGSMRLRQFDHRFAVVDQESPNAFAAPARAPIADDAAFVRHFDGLLFGPNPAEGVVRDEVLLHPALGLHVAFPKGWQVDNARHGAPRPHPARTVSWCSVRSAGALRPTCRSRIG
jgi:predicted Zn-dependent protease